MSLTIKAGAGNRANSFVNSCRLQARVILALFLRETRTRFGGSPIGYAWAVLDPLVHVAIWTILFVVLGRKAPLGDSMVVFVLTAYLPVMLVRRLSTSLSSAITGNRALLFFPIVHNADVVLARALLEIATALFVMILLFGVLSLFGFDSLPVHPIGALAAIGAVALLGVGWGYINAIVTTQFSSWPRFIGWGNRVIFLTSGIFFYPGMFPKEAQNVLWYFPVAHLVDWFRAMFFFGYESDFYMDWPIVLFASWCLLVGMALERILRRQLASQ